MSLWTSLPSVHSCLILKMPGFLTELMDGVQGTRSSLFILPVFCALYHGAGGCPSELSEVRHIPTACAPGLSVWEGEARQGQPGPGCGSAVTGFVTSDKSFSFLSPISQTGEGGREEEAGAQGHLTWVCMEY